ncbi:ribonucleoprotein PTB-binding 1-like [Daktulosphaira vitifoliae]|uniref:ribonucleoprotein PTB-binding 1-like n=1 Tax=Daktulosphaira vitifoliae TaxID=58002 RepID=UPI0021AA5776|nr:ribonucleoprotein PTB-binding 1-like [Daktulosphaira vitifoliae]
MTTETAKSIFAVEGHHPRFDYSKLDDPKSYWNMVGSAGHGGSVVLGSGAHQVLQATASTERFWAEEPEEEIKRKVHDAKTKFHRNRQLQLKHLPRTVTEDEIRKALIEFPIESVHISTTSGSSMAKVILEDPELRMEEWDFNKQFLIRGQRIPVSPTPTEMLLCVARLPLSYTEEQFSQLIQMYGEVEKSFLIISEKTGENKGYGFVEYTKKEYAIAAKSGLDGKEIRDTKLVCDWLDGSHITYESLHSKCLYVDKLPTGFRDMSEFRQMFAKVVNPPYCQIALKNGCPLDWGLVEYNSAEDAEKAQTELNGHILRGQKIRITYYIPGVRAINLFLKLLNEPSKSKCGGLLPDPPQEVIEQSLQNLSKQNPIFAQNLQNIIFNQIKASQMGPEIPDYSDSSLRSHLLSGKVPPAMLHSPTSLPFIGSAPEPFGARLLPSPPVGEVPPHLASGLFDGDLTNPILANYYRELLTAQILAGATKTNGFVGLPNSHNPTFGDNVQTNNNNLNHVDAVQKAYQNQNLQHNVGQQHNQQQNIVINIFGGVNSTTPPATPTPTTPTYPFGSSLSINMDQTWSKNTQTSTTDTYLASPIAAPEKSLSYSPSSTWSLQSSNSTPSPQSLYSPLAPNIWTPTSSTSSLSSQDSSRGQKRGIPPSPELSPEGMYIGQHSQGIGGHYADSYLKRNKKN